MVGDKQYWTTKVPDKKPIYDIHGDGIVLQGSEHATKLAQVIYWISGLLSGHQALGRRLQ